MKPPSPNAERADQRRAVGKSTNSALASLGVDLTLAFASCVALACYLPLPASVSFSVKWG